MPWDSTNSIVGAEFKDATTWIPGMTGLLLITVKFQSTANNPVGYVRIFCYKNGLDFLRSAKAVNDSATISCSETFLFLNTEATNEYSIYLNNTTDRTITNEVGTPAPWFSGAVLP